MISMKMKRFMASLLIAVMVISTTAIGAFAAVSTQNTYVNDTVIDFDITCTKDGEIVQGTKYGMTKSASGNAYFGISTCRNSTGKSVYAYSYKLSSKTCATKALTITGTGVFYLSYTSGYGSTGSAYYPAAQLSASATTSARIAGGWHA
jgi:hypothetical protein